MDNAQYLRLCSDAFIEMGHLVALQKELCLYANKRFRNPLRCPPSATLARGFCRRFLLAMPKYPTYDPALFGSLLFTDNYYQDGALLRVDRGDLSCTQKFMQQVMRKEGRLRAVFYPIPWKLKWEYFDSK